MMSVMRDGWDSEMTVIRDSIIQFIIDYYTKNKFYPSYDEIANGVCRAKATIHTNMRRLEAEGIIIRKANYSSQYRLINMDFICMQKAMK